MGSSESGTGSGEESSRLRARTKQFALAVIRFVDALPRDRVTDHVGRQALRSASSVGANYRAACRARSEAEMAAKLGIVEEEADETQFWLELLTESGRTEPELTRPLIQEADEIVRMVVASIKTIKGRRSSTRVRERLADYTPWIEDEPLLPVPRSELPIPQ